MSHRSPEKIRAALRASEALTDAILRSAVDVAIIVSDRAGLVTSWNSGAEAILGWPAKEMLGKPADVIFTPEDRAAGAPAQEMATADRDGRAADERWHLRRDGTCFFASGSMVPLLRDGEDVHRGYLKILRDRTEARLAEEARIAAARRHAALVATQQAVDAVDGDLDAVMSAVVRGALLVMPQADGAVIELRQGGDGSGDGDEIVYRAAAGTSAAHVGLRLKVASSFSGLCITQGRPLVCADSETDARVDREACRKVGVASMLAVPVPHHGRFVGVLKLHAAQPNVLTEADALIVQLLVGALAAGLSGVAEAGAEAALRELNATLERRIAEEVAARVKAEDALRQSQKMEALGQLTGGIAHDFNNLLTGIAGSLELMQKRVEQGRPASSLARYLGMAQTSVQRATALTHRLLAFGRRQPLDPRPVDVNELVAGMEDLLRRTVGEAVVLETALRSDLWPALCDAHQLENATLNLAINARDAMPNGAGSGGRLVVETANGELDEAYVRRQGGSDGDLQAGDYVVVSVSDTGAGMPPEVLARVFEPFFTTKSAGQGTGLGLSMVYGFVKQIGGHVRIHSTEGQGTSVRLYLPRHRGAVVAAGTGVQEAGQAIVPRAQGGETVLVVEDEAAVRSLVSEHLQELGYTVLDAVDSRSILPTLERGAARIDLLVTDVGLPGGMNGRELAEMAPQHRPALPVLFITGYAEQAAVRSGFLLGEGMAMLPKPFALHALAAKVRSMIEPGGLAAQP